MLGVVDLAPEERQSCAVLFGIVQQSKGIVGRAGAAAQHADRHVGVVLANLLHVARAVVDDLEENRTSGLSNPGERAQNLIVDEGTQFLRRDATVDVGIEHLKEVAEPLALGLLAKRMKRLERALVLLEIVKVGDGVQAKVRAGKRVGAAVAIQLTTLDVIDARRAKRLRWVAQIVAVARGPHVGGVVGAGSRGNVGVLKQAFLDGELLIDVGRHEHDIDQPLRHDLADDVEKLGQVPVAELVARPNLRRKLRWVRTLGRKISAMAKRTNPERHVRVLGIGDDKRIARSRVFPVGS